VKLHIEHLDTNEPSAITLSILTIKNGDPSISKCTHLAFSTFRSTKPLRKTMPEQAEIVPQDIGSREAVAGYPLCQTPACAALWKKAKHGKLCWRCSEAKREADIKAAEESCRESCWV
jgi:hypothetical protein